MPVKRHKMPPRGSPRSILRALWKHKLAIVLVWFAVSLAGAGVVFWLPPVYRSEALILVEGQRIPEKFVATTISLDLRDRLSSLSQQILSYRRLVEIIEKFDLYRDARSNRVQEEIVEMMRRDVSIRLEEGSKEQQPSAFRIGYRGKNPTVVALVANQLANSFIEENLRAREVFALGTSEFLITQLADAGRRLEEQEAKLSQYKLQHNGELPQQENVLIASSARLQVQLQGIQDALNRTQQNKMMTENAISAAEASLSAIIEISQRPNEISIPGMPAGTALTPVAALERRLAELRTQYTDQHPDVQRMAEILEETRQRDKREEAETKDAARTAGGGANPQAAVAVQKSRRNVSPLTETILREKERIQNLRAQQAAADKQMEVLTAEQRRNSKEIAGAQKRVERLPVREQELASITRDYEITKANYQSLLDKKLAAEMAADMEKRQKAERFTILDPARIAEKPVEPNRPLLGVLGSLAGLLLGLAIGLGNELRKDVVLGEWELPKHVPVLGRVPKIVPVAAPPGPAATGSPLRRILMVSSAVVLAVVMAVAVCGYFGWIPVPGGIRALWGKDLEGGPQWSSVRR